MSLVLRAFRFLLLFNLILLLLGTYWLARELYRPLPLSSESKTLEIEKGTSVRQISQVLNEKKLIRHPLLFILLYRLYFSPRHLQAGEYRFGAHESLKSILIKMIGGRVWLHQITVREGMTASEVALLLSSLGKSEKDFLEAIKDPGLIVDLDPEAKDLEGYLFPETYYFPKGITPQEAFKAMTDQFRKALPAEWKERAKEIGFSLREIVILASLIEKETGLAEERPLVAAVFYNRLKKGMKLDCDPTIIYAFQKVGLIKRQLLEKDLGFPSPYNTYLYLGLPPGPICNPGREALQAALYPAQTNFLYFVSKGDGSHHFSPTYQEHLKAKAFYQRRRMQRNQPPR